MPSRPGSLCSPLIPALPPLAPFAASCNTRASGSAQCPVHPLELAGPSQPNATPRRAHVLLAGSTVCPVHSIHAQPPVISASHGFSRFTRTLPLRYTVHMSNALLHARGTSTSAARSSPGPLAWPSASRACQCAPWRWPTPVQPWPRARPPSRTGTGTQHYWGIPRPPCLSLSSSARPPITRASAPPGRCPAPCCCRQAPAGPRTQLPQPGAAAARGRKKQVNVITRCNEASMTRHQAAGWRVGRMAVAVRPGRACAWAELRTAGEPAGRINQPRGASTCHASILAQQPASPLTTVPTLPFPPQRNMLSTGISTVAKALPPGWMQHKPDGTAPSREGCLSRLAPAVHPCNSPCPPLT